MMGRLDNGKPRWQFLQGTLGVDVEAGNGKPLPNVPCLENPTRGHHKSAVTERHAHTAAPDILGGLPSKYYNCLAFEIR